jgi:FkbM family methyltransferase
MITHPSFLKRKLRGLALYLFNALENNGTADFARNGERRFVDNLFGYLEKQAREPVVLFDVGANKGEYAQLLLEHSARLDAGAELHLFEPTRTCFELLQTRFAANPGVILNRRALSSAAGVAEIFFDIAGSGLASLERRNLDAYAIRLDQSETVETIRLDDYLGERQVKHVHFLKIDVEGHEMAAFEGMGRFFSGDFVDFVQFEYGGANLDSHTSLMDFYARFAAAGFVVAKILPAGLDIRPYKPWMDNFCYANYVAISNRVASELR